MPTCKTHDAGVEPRRSRFTFYPVIAIGSYSAQPAGWISQTEPATLLVWLVWILLGAWFIALCREIRNDHRHGKPRMHLAALGSLATAIVLMFLGASARMVAAQVQLEVLKAPYALIIVALIGVYGVLTIVSLSAKRKS